MAYSMLEIMTGEVASRMVEAGIAQLTGCMGRLQCLQRWTNCGSYAESWCATGVWWKEFVAALWKGPGAC
jgi:hypothetical protein